ncbi:capsule biosynthesis protein [Shimia biformata]|uniref:capsule biosynthesis protein n=1 Tax=Shimia biformata TaxID=1294299 RepID=UPI00194DB8AB|nr:capsule biosynthesis protein [Shimia biformata]
MTTKPRAKKFRIRRSVPGDVGTTMTDAVGNAARQAVPADQPTANTQTRPTPVDSSTDTPPPRPQASTTEAPSQDAARPQMVSATRPTPSAPPVSNGQLSPEQEIDAIKREGLTGRQLRMARRVAQKHGIAATSDYDAIRLLREQGIDPFQRSNMLELIGNTGGQSAAPAGGAVQLPQTMPLQKEQLPSTEMASPIERRIREISEIQRDIGRRRRRKLALLLARLSVFVFLPTLFAGWYFYSVATPMYSTKSEFLILQADQAAGSGFGSLLSGTQFATNQDSIATQSYLQSKDAMLRLDADEGFKAHFSNPAIDPIQRLDENPSNEQAYKIYKKYVKIGYDPTEGVIRMEVSAADPAVSASFSKALITYAEERVDDLSRRKRSDQLKDAEASLEKAKADRRDAQERLVKLQEGTVLDPEGLIASLRTQISNIQVQLQEKELQLQALLDNQRPNQARVEGVQGDIRRLRNLLDTLERKMTEEVAGEASLAEKTSQIQMAQADLATADLLMQSALQTLKQTELEANRQVRYLTTSVEPVASEDPSYPRKFENTALAFLIFSGIYLMISLTASILREQVSS